MWCIGEGRGERNSNFRAGALGDVGRTGLVSGWKVLVQFGGALGIELSLTPDVKVGF